MIHESRLLEIQERHDVPRLRINVGDGRANRKRRSSARAESETETAETESEVHSEGQAFSRRAPRVHARDNP
jgi:hypothetical protein